MCASRKCGFCWYSNKSFIACLILSYRVSNGWRVVISHGEYCVHVVVTFARADIYRRQEQRLVTFYRVESGGNSWTEAERTQRNEIVHGENLALPACGTPVVLAEDASWSETEKNITYHVVDLVPQFLKFPQEPKIIASSRIYGSAELLRKNGAEMSLGITIGNGFSSISSSTIL